MSDYIFEPDGKIHTRFSELKRCTPGQIDKVVLDRLEGRAGFQSDSMLFGKVRHNMWETESKQTGRTPLVFDKALGGSLPVSHVEFEMATEMVPNVVIHSRIDSAAIEYSTVFDYKTAVDGVNGWRQNVSKYATDRQLKFYAAQLGFHGHRVLKGAYLCEIWNKDQTKIIDYKAIWQEYTLHELAKVLPYIRDRVAMLVSAVNRAETKETVSI